uniref:Uncharacterized protein n=1 Tax=Solanum tuberosum TaxID=4113 RepID=M1DQV0_SOLTU
MYPHWINKKFHLLNLWTITNQGHVFMSSFAQLTREKIVEKRNKLSQSGNSTNVSYGRKRKNIEPSGGEERNVENNRRRKSSPTICECITNKPFIEEVSGDDDLLEEETDPDIVILDKESGPGVVIIAEEEEEEKSDPDVVIFAKADPMMNSTDMVVSSTLSMCRKANISKDLPDKTPYS